MSTSKSSKDTDVETWFARLDTLRGDDLFLAEGIPEPELDGRPEPELDDLDVAGWRAALVQFVATHGALLPEGAPPDPPTPADDILWDDPPDPTDVP